MERGREIGGAREPLGGVFGERLRECPLDGDGRVRPQGPHRAGDFGHLLRHRRARAAPAQRGLPRQHLVHDAREAVDVALVAEARLPARLFRAHVFRGSDGDTRVRHDIGRRRHSGDGAGARDAEVREHRVPVGEQDVLRLHVAMDETVAVGVVEPRPDFLRDAQGVLDREPRLPLQSLPQRSSGDVRLHVVEQPIDLA